MAASQVALDAEEERLRVGLSTAYQVALMQNDLVAAEGINIQTRVNYIKALIAHEVAAGGFLERNGIVFDEALRGNLWTDPQKP